MPKKSGKTKATAGKKPKPKKAVVKKTKVKKVKSKKVAPKKIKAKEAGPAKVIAKKAKSQVVKEMSKPGAKFIYYFGDGKAEGHGKMKDILGGKGAGLAEMTNTGAPVPAGFTISTEACRLFYDNDMRLPKGLEKEVARYMTRVEKSMGARFGDPTNPLLVSVRSGAKFSIWDSTTKPPRA